jgi:membrane protease YdiL (CAAX protease family)
LWTIRYAAGAYAVNLVVGFSLAVGLTGSELRLGVGVLAIDAVMLASLAPLYKTRAFSARELGLRSTAPAPAVGLVTGAIVVIGLVNTLWIHGVLGLPVGNSLGIRLHESGATAVLTGFALAVSAPVVEEIFFRGLLYRALRNRLNVAYAAVIAGVLFGLVHASTYPLDTLPPKVVFGVLACLLYEYTGSLYPSIALHMLIDATGFEVAVTGHGTIVVLGFIAIGIALLGYAVIRHSHSPPTAAGAAGESDPAAGDLPGWKPNPAGQGFRYWDGENWTDSYTGAGLAASFGSWLRRPVGAASYLVIWLLLVLAAAQPRSHAVLWLAIILNLVGMGLIGRDNQACARRYFAGYTIPTIFLGPLVYLPWTLIRTGTKAAEHGDAHARAQ